MGKDIWRIVKILIFSWVLILGVLNLVLVFPVTAAFLSHEGNMLERSSYVCSEVTRLLSGGGWLQQTALSLHQELVGKVSGVDWGYLMVILISWVLALAMFFRGKSLVDGIRLAWAGLKSRTRPKASEEIPVAEKTQGEVIVGFNPQTGGFAG